ncbi:hypothetical protein GLOIN_2v1787829 [Rhizophagus irregularis DAOM 181602=DAOM 197198]|nr:hypothetical protein GLOIN_2v1787829 [Rhizophagus irregularis DAOM 181602=DAOM 197198]
MSNVHTLNDIKDREGGSYKKPGHRLGSAYEQELKKKLRSVTEFNSEINDLSEKLVDKYNEREKESQRTYADIRNKISQLNASSAKVKSQLISERKSHSESYLRELEGKLDDLELEQVLHDLNAVGGVIEEPAQSDPKKIDSLRLELDRVKEDLNSKNYEIECMEKGKEVSDNIYKRELDIRSSERLKLMEENSSLRDQLALKKEPRGASHNEVDTVTPLYSEPRYSE